MWFPATVLLQSRLMSSRYQTEAMKVRLKIVLAIQHPDVAYSSCPVSLSVGRSCCELKLTAFLCSLPSEFGWLV